MNNVYKPGDFSDNKAVRSVIRFQSVNYTIGSSVLVDHLDLEVAESETLVLLGRSGSGKTTTLKLINHLLMPTSGEVMVQGQSTRSWDPIRLRRQIGYVIQDVGLFPHFTVARNVSLVPRLEGWEQNKIERRVREVLDLVGLEPDRFAQRYPHELSGGQRQRVGVARALCADPPILLLDEPFGALDTVTRSEVQKEFQTLRKSLTKTVVFVTHDLFEAFLLADRIGLMEDGKLVALDSPHGFRLSDSPLVREFLAPFLKMAEVLEDGG